MAIADVARPAEDRSVPESETRFFSKIIDARVTLLKN